MKSICHLALLVGMSGLICLSTSGQVPAASPQPSPVQGSQNADQPGTSQQGLYIDPSGHPHLPLTPEGDVVTPPGTGLKNPANGKLAGARNFGIPATPVLSCPARPVPTPLPKAAEKERNHLAAYIFFFNNMEALDGVADQDEKRGDLESAADWRTHDQRAIGLNDAEGQIMKEIRVDYTNAKKNHDKKMLQAIRNHRLATNGDMCAPSPPEFAELDRENWEIVQTRVEQLRVALGAVAFKKMDDFVRRVFEPKPPLGEIRGASR